MSNHSTVSSSSIRSFARQRRLYRFLSRRLGYRAAGWLLRYLFTRENGYALLVALMMIGFLMFGAPGRQPTFVYGGF